MKRLAAAAIPACPETVRLLPSPHGTARTASFALPALPAAEPAAAGRAKARLYFPAPFLAQLALQGDDAAEVRVQRRERVRLATETYSAPRPRAGTDRPCQEWWV